MSTLRVNGIVDGVGGNTATVNGKLPLGTSDLATQLEAQAGTDNTKVMTPLRAAQAIAALGGMSGINIQRFDVSGTYTPTASYRFAFCIVVGGGGGGAGCLSTQRASPGGGGATTIGILNLSGLASQTVTIGAGGLGSAAGNGTNGGTTSIGTLITAAGGSGGQSGTGTSLVGVSGSTGTGGLVLVAPDAGLISNITTGNDLWIAGSSPFFMGHSNGAAALDIPGRGQGGTACHYSASGSKAGRNGGAGYVIIMEFK